MKALMEPRFPSTKQWPTMRCNAAAVCHVLGLLRGVFRPCPPSFLCSPLTGMPSGRSPRAGFPNDKTGTAFTAILHIFW